MSNFNLSNRNFRFNKIDMFVEIKGNIFLSFALTKRQVDLSAIVLESSLTVNPSFQAITMSLTVADVSKIVALIEDGRSQRYVSRTLEIPRTTVQDAWNRYLETGTCERRAGSGRKRVTTLVDDRFLVLNTLRDRRSTAVQLQHRLLTVRGIQISERTIRRRLVESGLNSRRPATGPQLLPRHRRARLQFAQLHADWNLQQWSEVLFTDESRFCLRSPDGRERVWRRRGERYFDCMISERLSFNGGSVMVWAGISTEAHTDLLFVENGALNAQRYVEDILQEAVVPFSHFVGDGFVLMHDNARPHTARVVTEYLDEVGIRRLHWPACSPDLNPIEHLWDQLQRRIRGRPAMPETLQELRLALQEEFEGIPQMCLTDLINSMPRRLNAVIQARGGHTRY